MTAQKWTTLLVVLAGLLVAASAARADDDWVQTRDGEMLRGQVRLDGGQVIVQPPNGSAVRLGLDELRLWSRGHHHPERGVLSGWFAQYYRDDQWKDLALERIDTGMIHWHRSPWPPSPLPRKDFSVRWTGRLLVPETNVYRFSNISYRESETDIWINGQHILQKGASGREGTIRLTGGEFADVRMEFRALEENNDTRLYWRIGSRSRQPVPQQWLFMPEQFDLKGEDEHRLGLAQSPPLEVEFFANDRFEDQVLMRREMRPSMMWTGDDPFDEGVYEGDMSVRLTGRLRIPRAARYTFRGSSWGASQHRYRVWMDGELVLERGDEIGLQKEMDLEAGQVIDLRMEYSGQRLGRGQRGMRLEWEIGDDRRTIIPAEAFVLPPVVPRVAMVLPQEGGADGRRLELRAAAAVDEGKIARVEFVAGNEVLATATRPPYTATLRDLRQSRMSIRARAVTAAGEAVRSDPVQMTLENVPNEQLGEPWSHVVLSSAPELQIEPDDQRLNVSSSRSRPIAQADRMAMVYQRLDEDGQIVVRVLETKPGENGGDALAGLMLRESLAEDSPYLGLAAGNGRAWVMRRRSAGQWPDFNWPTVQMPAWLKLSRSGGRLTAHVSEDGQSWRQVGSGSVRPTAPVYAGFTVLCTAEGDASAVVDNLQVIQRPFKPRLAEGLELADGSFIPGRVSIAEEGLEVRVSEDQQRLIKPQQTARVMLVGMAPEAIEDLPEGATGALLQSGDFHEGDVRSIQPGRVTINSLLFGPQRLSPSGMAVVVLREPQPASGSWEVTLLDGSRWMARSMRIRSGRLEFDADDRQHRVDLSDLRQLRAVE